MEYLNDMNHVVVSGLKLFGQVHVQKGGLLMVLEGISLCGRSENSDLE
jgi:hypothetical protein